MMKNLTRLTALLPLCACSMLCACGGSSASSAAIVSSAASVSSVPAQAEAAPSSEEVTSSAAQSEIAAQSESTQESDASKSLVVYFSWSGNTRQLAESIQQQTGSDIFEIVPVTPYSDDYNTVVSDAKAEQQNDARPEIVGSIDDIDSYDTVYVGFPNWWGDMPMILYTFFDEYDLSGKTVALFCTSGGSGLSNTVSEVAVLEPGATVTAGLHIRDNALQNVDTDVAAWLSEIGTVQ